MITSSSDDDDSALPKKYRQRYHYRSNKRKNVTCSNCNSRGHVFKDCMEPIISNGLLCYTLKPKTPNTSAVQVSMTPEQLEVVLHDAPGACADDFLQWIRELWKSGQFDLHVCLVQRRHTISYEAFIRGKYTMDQLPTHQHRMTESERKRILEDDWDTMYEDIMASKDARYMHKEKRRAKELFDSIDLHNFLEEAQNIYNEPPWEFPKGRRFTNETDFQCATREFEEETNVPISDVLALHTDDFVENFLGVNEREYNNKYFLAIAHPGARGPYLDPENTGQVSEVQNARWFPIEEALELLRPFHEKKREVLETSYRRLLHILR